MRTLSAVELTQMIDQARAGSADALGQLLQMYRSYLRLVASLQTSEQLQPKVSPSDLVQGTFLQAQRCFQDFRGSSEGELVNWLRKILASQLAMEARRYSTERRDLRLERRMHLEVDQSSARVESMLKAGGESPSENVLRRERVVMLADALSQLPDDQRQIIVMRHLQGRSFAEVAAATDRTLDSVKSAWQRGLANLRKTLGDGVL